MSVVPWLPSTVHGRDSRLNFTSTFHFTHCALSFAVTRRWSRRKIVILWVFQQKSKLVQMFDIISHLKIAEVSKYFSTIILRLMKQFQMEKKLNYRNCSYTLRGSENNSFSPSHLSDWVWTEPPSSGGCPQYRHQRWWRRPVNMLQTAINKHVKRIPSKCSLISNKV